MIKYVKGDATIPCVESGVRIIAHVCNDIGKFGSGFAACVAKRWGVVRDRYVKWSVTPNSLFSVGMVQIVPVGEGLYVANMIAQNGVRSQNNPHPINYLGLGNCLNRLAKWIDSYVSIKNHILIPNICPDVTIHMPRIGCGLAGGQWEVVEPIIEIMLPRHDVYIYDLEKSSTHG